LLSIVCVCSRRYLSCVDVMNFEVPKHGADIPRIVNPRSQPCKITERHEFARSLGVLRFKRLKLAKNALVSNSPWYEYQRECDRINATSCKRMEHSIAQAVARHRRDHDGKSQAQSEQAGVRAHFDRKTGNKATQGPP